MLQKCQLQRVNRIGKLTVGMLTQKEGRDCPSGWTGDDWLASPIGTANAPIFSAHAHKVGHSSQPVSISATHLCNNLWLNCLIHPSILFYSHPTGSSFYKTIVAKILPLVTVVCGVPTDDVVVKQSIVHCNKTLRQSS